MANLYKQISRSDNWIMKLKSPSGKWYSKTTGTADRDKAEKILLIYNRMMSGEQSVAETKKILEDIINSLDDKLTNKPEWLSTTTK
jgi:hypothetical protein